MLTRVAADLPEEEAEIVESGGLMAEDPALRDAVERAVLEDGLTAGAAILRAARGAAVARRTERRETPLGSFRRLATADRSQRAGRAARRRRTGGRMGLWHARLHRDAFSDSGDRPVVSQPCRTRSCGWQMGLRPGPRLRQQGRRRAAISQQAFDRVGRNGRHGRSGIERRIRRGMRSPIPRSTRSGRASS